MFGTSQVPAPKGLWRGWLFNILHDLQCRVCVCACVYVYIYICEHIYICMHRHIRPTQSVMYVPLQLNSFHESVLLIVQYKYLKSCSGDFYSPASDPPHKIVRYWFYYSIWLCFSFSPDHAGQVEMICTTVVPVSKGHLGGASPPIFLHYS